MVAAENPPVVLHAEQEHGGIRLVVFLSLFVAYWLSFQLLSWFLENFGPRPLVDYSVFLSCVGAVPLALLVVWALENALKRVWPSGLSLLLDKTGLYVRDRRAGAATRFEENTPALLWAEPIASTNWYFRLSGYQRGGRERRVAKNWLCLATQLQQNDARLIVYTFMSPDHAGKYTENKALGFRIINPAELHDKTLRSRIGPPTRPQLSNELLHSKDGRFWLAEKRRWEEGIELTPEDFATLSDHVTAAGATFATPSLSPEPGA